MKRTKIRKRFDEELLKDVLLFLSALLNLISIILKSAT